MVIAIDIGMDYRKEIEKIEKKLTRIIREQKPGWQAACDRLAVKLQKLLNR